MAYFSASGGTSYSWSGANSLGGGAARMSWSVPGTYMVSVGSGGASQQATVIVTDQPQQQITASPLQTWIGAGQIAYFSANATGGDVPGYPVGYAWTNATPVASGAGAAWGRWSTPGTQIVSVYASGQVGAYAASPTLSLVVHVMPAGFNQNSASGTGASNFVASRRDGTMHQGGDPVELATGAYVTSHRLAFFPGPGSRPISIGYNSLLAATQTQPGIFGYGWTSEFEANLIPSGKNLVFNLDATHSTTFVPQAGSTTTFVCAQEGDEYDILKTNSGGGWTLTFRDQSELLFASSGLLAAEVDPHGRQLTVNRNGQNQITSITDSVSGAGLALSYGSNGCVSSVTDPLGGVVNLSYSSGNALITTISDQNAHPITFTYDSSGDLLSTTDGTGNVVVQNTYDGAGRVVSQQDGIATHPAATFSYQQNGLSSDIVTTMVDRSGSTWVYTYDPNYHLISLLDPDRSTISYTYDFYGNLTSCTDPVGNKQQFTYDASGNRLTATDAAGNTTTYSYDSHNRLLTAKDSLGNTVTYAYDLSNNVLSVTDANGKVTSWTYDANAQPLTRTLPNGGIYHFTYVGGYPATRTAPTGETTSQPSHRDRQSIVH
jgi:YD repeat-containing protein